MTVISVKVLPIVPSTGDRTRRYKLYLLSLDLAKYHNDSNKLHILTIFVIHVINEHWYMSKESLILFLESIAVKSQISLVLKP